MKDMIKDIMKYADIINLPHHQSRKHPHMPVEDRAAQFSPFAALTGHDAAIKETARLTDRKIELDEYEIAALDEKLQSIRAQLEVSKDKAAGRFCNPEITVTYFRPDVRKDGGEYVTITGIVKKIDEYGGCLAMNDGMKIPIQEILELQMSDKL